MRKGYRRQNYMEGIVNYLYRTWKNKIAAIIMVVLGILGLSIDNDATFLVLVLFIATPMFFSNETWFY